MAAIFEDPKATFGNTPFERWANKLAHDKLAMDRVSDNDRSKLIELCVVLAEKFPYVTCKVHPRCSRKEVCEAAIDLGIDLLAIKCQGRHRRGKPLIGRGLLDVWTEVLKERFGGVVGTNAWFEQKRRDVVTRLSKEKRHESEA